MFATVVIKQLAELLKVAFATNRLIVQAHAVKVSCVSAFTAEMPSLGFFYLFHSSENKLGIDAALLALSACSSFWIFANVMSGLADKPEYFIDSS